MTALSTDRIVVLAGALCSGKTTLAHGLCSATGSTLVSAREVIAAAVPRDTREGMQDAGRQLERETRGAWLAAAVRDHAATTPLVVDSARTLDQVEALRALGRPTWLVYLSASEGELRRRFDSREDPLDRGRTFDDAMAGELRSQLADVAPIADQAIDTDAVGVDEVRELVLRSGCLSRAPDR